MDYLHHTESTAVISKLDRLYLLRRSCLCADVDSGKGRRSSILLLGGCLWCSALSESKLLGNCMCKEETYRKREHRNNMIDYRAGILQFSKIIPGGFSLYAKSAVWRQALTVVHSYYIYNTYGAFLSEDS